MRRAERWILQRQEADGSWGGIQPPWVYSLMALHLQGYALDHPVHARPGSPASTASRSTTTRAGASRPASRRCGTPPWPSSPSPTPVARPSDPVLRSAAAGCSARRSPCPATGPCAAPTSARGLGLRVRQRQLPRHRRHGRGRAGPRADRRATRPAAVERAVAWIEGMQCRDGGWGAFDVDNTQDSLPRAALLRLRRADRPAERGRDRPRGRDAGQAWGAAGRRSTGAWPGCSRPRRPTAPGSGAGAPTTSTAPAPSCRRSWPRACRAEPPGRSAGPSPGWRRHQNDDGGWGEDLRSYDDPSQAGRGASTASQTAWALLALLAAGERSPGRRDRGVGFLVAHPARRRHLGRAVLHRHRVSRATSTSTTTSTGWSSRSWPWAAYVNGDRPRLSSRSSPRCGSRRFAVGGVDVVIGAGPARRPAAGAELAARLDERTRGRPRRRRRRPRARAAPRRPRRRQRAARRPSPAEARSLPGDGLARGRVPPRRPRAC